MGMDCSIKASWARHARRATSMCTGAFTSEMALASVQNVINMSGLAEWEMHIKPVACWDTWSDDKVVLIGPRQWVS